MCTYKSRVRFPWVRVLSLYPQVLDGTGGECIRADLHLAVGQIIASENGSFQIPSGTSFSKAEDTSHEASRNLVFSFFLILFSLYTYAHICIWKWTARPTKLAYFDFDLFFFLYIHIHIYAYMFIYIYSIYI